MSRKPQHFAQRDVTRAVNAAKAAGVEVSVVEVQLADGVIIRISGPRGSCDKQNPWDEVLSDAAAGTSIAGSMTGTGKAKVPGYVFRRRGFKQVPLPGAPGNATVRGWPGTACLGLVLVSVVF